VSTLQIITALSCTIASHLGMLVKTAKYSGCGEAVLCDCIRPNLFRIGWSARVRRLLQIFFSDIDLQTWHC